MRTDSSLRSVPYDPVKDLMPEQFAAVIKADMARMSKVIKEAGIRE